MIIDFEWQGLEQLKSSEFLKTRIGIETAYKWGEGWTTQEAKDFENELYPKLIREGFAIEQPKDSIGCDHIRKGNNIGLVNYHDKTDLYLHPMELTGYIRKDDLSDLLRILGSCDCIHKIGQLTTSEVYDITDAGYIELLMNNAVNIKENFIDKLHENERFKRLYGNDGFEFAKKFRLPRVGDGTGISSCDVDVSFVSNLSHMYDLIKENEAEKNLDNCEIERD